MIGEGVIQIHVYNMLGSCLLFLIFQFCRGRSLDCTNILATEK